MLWTLSFFIFQTLQFETLKSGILTATNVPGTSLVQMKLPLNPATVHITRDNNNPCWQIVAQATPGVTDRVHEVKFSPTSGKLLIVMNETSFTRADLESLVVVKDRLLAVRQDQDLRVKGVMITVKGEGGKYDFCSRYRFLSVSPGEDNFYFFFMF